MLNNYKFFERKRSAPATMFLQLPLQQTARQPLEVGEGCGCGTSQDLQL